MAIHLGSQASAAAREAPLAGRTAELGALDDALGRLDEWALALELSGEPGIGKTRLLAELADRAAKRNRLVLTGRAIELERDVPFAPFIDALADHLAMGEDRLPTALTPDERGELSQIFPALSTPAEGPGAPVSERFRAHRALRSLLEAIAREKPFVICLDDLHWADDASIEAIDYLLRRPPRGPVLLALAFRPRGAPDRLLAALAAAEREGRCVALRIGPLNREEADPLLSALPSDARDVVFRESGGNPFYLDELLRIGAGPIKGRASGPALAGAEVPSAVSSALAVELDALSAPAIALLRGAAVLGEPFQPELAAEVSEVDGDRWPVALDELIGRDLVRPTDAPRRLRFRHPIVRLAVYEGIPHGWRLPAHARAASALSRLGAPALGLAPHVEASAAAGDPEAIAVLTEAARTAEPRAPGAAAHWYRAALQILPRGDHRRLELLISLATSLGSSGDLHASRSVLLEVLDQLPADAGMERVRLVAFLAAIDHQLGYHEEARARNLAMVEETGVTESPESVAALIELATDASYTTSDRDSACELGSQALELARRVGAPALTAAAAAILCASEQGRGRIDVAERRRAEASAAIDALSDEELATRLDASLHLGLAELYLEHHETAIARLARGVEVSRIAGQGQFIVPMRASQAWALCAAGRLAEADAIADAALEGARLQGTSQVLAWALWTKALVRYMAGDLSAALQWGEESASVCGELEPSVVADAAHGYHAAICVEAGMPERALEELDRAGAPDFPRFEPGRRPIWAEVAVTAMLALGRRDEAAAWADRAQQLVEPEQLPVASGIAKRAEARVLLDAAKPVDASEAAMVAADRQVARGARIEAARSRLLAGQALAAAGDRDGATAQLDPALGELEACGSSHWAAAARRELRRLGRRVGARRSQAQGTTGLAALSGREREIAELVAHGLTNREVAERLFISRKTVESHLARVFEKLDVSRRVQVGAAIERDRSR